MTNGTTKPDSFEPATDTAAHLFDNWFNPVEAGLSCSAQRHFLTQTREAPGGKEVAPGAVEGALRLMPFSPAGGTARSLREEARSTPPIRP